MNCLKTIVCLSFLSCLIMSCGSGVNPNSAAASNASNGGGETIPVFTYESGNGTSNVSGVTGSGTQADPLSVSDANGCAEVRVQLNISNSPTSVSCPDPGFYNSSYYISVAGNKSNVVFGTGGPNNTANNYSSDSYGFTVHCTATNGGGTADFYIYFNGAGGGC